MLIAPWNRVAIRTLPRVWRKTQVIRIEYAVVMIKKAMTGWRNCGVPAMKKVGRCHSHHTTPRIRLATSGENRCISLGRA